MKIAFRSIWILLCAVALFVSSVASATVLMPSRGEQKQVFGEYEVHYIGLTTSFLTPEVSSTYNIPRSSSMGFLSISIVKAEPNAEAASPLTGSITGTIRNLVGQSRKLEFREIKNGHAVYYISTFRFDDADLYHVNLEVRPSGLLRTFDVKFTQRFYNE